MTTTILLLVSREAFLDEVFKSLEELKCNVGETALLVIVNGEADLFVKTRNLCELSKYPERLCLQVRPRTKVRQYDIGGRRKRIATLHNYAREHINTEYVFGVEDDTIVPSNALELLGEQMIDGVGMVEGVEMGRWGVPYIGAWLVDNIDEPTKIVSMPQSSGVVDIDAGGFYCFITRAEYYKAHDFKPFDNNGLGPDVDFSLGLRRQGLKVLAHFDVECIHKNADGDIVFGITIPRQVRMFKKGNQWRQNILS